MRKRSRRSKRGQRAPVPSRTLVGGAVAWRNPGVRALKRRGPGCRFSSRAYSAPSSLTGAGAASVDSGSAGFMCSPRKARVRAQASSAASFR